MTNMLARKGYIALTTVLVIMIVLITVLVSTQSITSGAIRSSLAGILGKESYVVAESCMNDALIRLRRDSSYMGGTLNISTGSCTITVVDLSGNEKRIEVVASIQDTYFQRLTSNIELLNTADTVTIILLSKYRG
jgi:hypothetical protein